MGDRSSTQCLRYCRAPAAGSAAHAVRRAGYLNALPYNTEHGGETLRSFRGVVGTGTAHCLEAALFAAVVLEQHGFPPLVLSFESVDLLDHVIFVYQRRGQWGSIARSRDPGLHGRQPLFATPRALALSYVDPYVDYTGEVQGYAVVDMRRLGDYDWRFSAVNVWKAERLLLDYPHRRIRTVRAASRGSAPVTCGFAPSTRTSSRCTTGAANDGCRCRGTSGLPKRLNAAGAQRRARADHSAMRQSRSKSRVGFVIGSVFACLSASSKRLASASPRPRSAATDC